MRLIPLPHPILVAAGDDVDLARAVEPERDRHRAVEEVAVVADDQHRAVVIGDHFLEQVERLEVEVVGRLVEHQQVRVPGELARQQQPRALAARQRRRSALDQRRLEQELLEIALDVLLARRGPRSSRRRSASTSRTRLVGSISLRCWSMTMPLSVFASVTLPLSGASSPVSSLSKVVLPAPLAPTMPIRSPRWMRSEKSRMIGRSP